MPKIKNYITQDDGTTTVVVEGVDIDNKTSLLLDNGLDVECEVKPVDPFKITDKQRRKIFALCNDIVSVCNVPIFLIRILHLIEHTVLVRRSSYRPTS